MSWSNWCAACGRELTYPQTNCGCERVSMRKQPERALLLRCIKLLRLAGWTGGKIKTTGALVKTARGFRRIKDPYLFVGAPDALFLRGDTVLAIETKATGKQSTEQGEFMARFHNPQLKRFYCLVRDEEEIAEYWKR
jgi:hypothetical protein